MLEPECSPEEHPDLKRAVEMLLEALPIVDRHCPSASAYLSLTIELCGAAAPPPTI